jgi:hypothetical protein
MSQLDDHRGRSGDVGSRSCRRSARERRDAPVLVGGLDVVLHHEADCARDLGAVLVGIAVGVIGFE